jgi:hypothetical protein
MRRSNSSTSLNSQCSSSSTLVPIVTAKKNLPRVSSICRVHDLFADVIKEIGVESITQTPTYMSGICYASYGSLDSLDTFETQVFPDDLLSKSEEATNYAACIACPPEDPEVESRKIEIVIRLRRVRRVYNLVDLVE